MKGFFKKRFQKWPAKVGYGTLNGLWYEYWNDMSFRPTPWTRILLFYRPASSFIIMSFRIPFRFIINLMIPLLKKFFYKIINKFF